MDAELMRRPLSLGTLRRFPGRCFWRRHGTPVLITAYRRVGRCLELTLADGRSFLADFGSPIYIRLLRRRH